MSDELLFVLFGVSLIIIPIAFSHLVESWYSMFDEKDKKDVKEERD